MSNKTNEPNGLKLKEVFLVNNPIIDGNYGIGLCLVNGEAETLSLVRIRKKLFTEKKKIITLVTGSVDMYKVLYDALTEFTLSKETTISKTSFKSYVSIQKEYKDGYVNLECSRKHKVERLVEGSEPEKEILSKDVIALVIVNTNVSKIFEMTFEEAVLVKNLIGRALKIHITY